MAGFDLHLPLPELPLLAAVFPPTEIREADEIWPPRGTPEPDLHAHGMTEARCVVEFFHGRKIGEKLDALKHLANICTLKAGRAYWSPKPFVRFVNAPTAEKDWENCDPSYPFLQKVATRGWFTTQLPEHIDRYSPRHTTKRELLELARLRDRDLLHVCHALVCDLLNESAKQQRNEIHCSAMWEEDGQEFYLDAKREVATQPSKTPGFKRDYAGAVEMLVKDRNLRTALPKQVRQTLELVFRKLDAGIDAREIVAAVARDLHRDQRTVRRHFTQSLDAANDLASESAKLMNVLASHVLPDNHAVAQSTPFRPQVDALAESAALTSSYQN